MAVRTRLLFEGFELALLVISALGCSNSGPNPPHDSAAGGMSSSAASNTSIASAVADASSVTGATTNAVSGGTANGSTTANATNGGVSSGGDSVVTTGEISSTTGSTAAGGASSTTATLTATTGVPLSCSNEVVSTNTRPQLDGAAAAEHTLSTYLASAGPLGALTTDDWDPSAGLGDPSRFTPTFTVAADGSGTHLTVQAALDAARGSDRHYILIEPGTYRETLSLPSSAPPITLYGSSSDPSEVVLVDGKSAESAGGTSASATFTVKAAEFQALNLTISNDFPTPASGSGLQAVALHTQGDRTVLENVVLHGFQDTLYLDTLSDTTVARVYIKDSFIEGDTDFIFGRATVVIQNSTIHYLSSRKGDGSGIHLAPSTHVDQPYGFLVMGCEFTADAGAPDDRAYLGRSWDTSSTTPTPNGQALVRESRLGAHLRQVDPWAPAATSGRAYSAAGNRLHEYCNTNADAP